MHRLRTTLTLLAVAAALVTAVGLEQALQALSSLGLVVASTSRWDDQKGSEPRV